MHHSKWAARVGAFINLESLGPGGVPIVFQHSGAWTVHAYAAGAAHPRGAIVAQVGGGCRTWARRRPQPTGIAQHRRRQLLHLLPLPNPPHPTHPLPNPPHPTHPNPHPPQDIYDAGLVMGETDFSRLSYRHAGALPGIDIAYLADGAAYHTGVDTMARLRAGVLQVRGGQGRRCSAVPLALLRLGAAAPEARPPPRRPRPRTRPPGSRRDAPRRRAQDGQPPRGARRDGGGAGAGRAGAAGRALARARGAGAAGGGALQGTVPFAVWKGHALLQPRDRQTAAPAAARRGAVAAVGDGGRRARRRARAARGAARGGRRRGAGARGAGADARADRALWRGARFCVR
jgi:hypothetical protein